MRYDVRFVFAEVNADVVYWARPAPNREFSPVNVDRTLIGELFINFVFFISEKFYNKKNGSNVQGVHIYI